MIDEIITQPIPNGNISVLAVDGATGIPIPNTGISGSGMYNGSMVSFGGQADSVGYFNQSVEAGTYLISAYSSIGDNKAENVEIKPGQNTTITIELERRDFYDPYKSVEFSLVDGAGDPISYLPLGIVSMDYMYVIHTQSDQEGVVHVNIPDGKFLLTSHQHEYSYYPQNRSHLAVHSGYRLEVTESGDYGDIPVYSTDPLDEVSGFVRDKDTGEVIPYALVEAGSYHGEDADDENKFMWPVDRYDQGISLLFEQESGSGHDGFYRIWGREKVHLECEVDGYYPYRKIHDLSTRSVNAIDIPLQKLQDYTTWINGTLVDEDGNPLEGEIRVYDMERDSYPVNDNITGIDGIFSMDAYPGHFRITFENDTLSGEIEISVPAWGMEDLTLKLIAYSSVSGNVKIWDGSPAEGINVTLVDVGAPGNETVDWMVTDGDGDFWFQVTKGAYRIVIIETEDYGGYSGKILSASGWNLFKLDIKLVNRTTGTITGTVVGDGGPLKPGIDGCLILLHDSEDEVIGSAISGDDAPPGSEGGGYFVFTDVPYGSGYHVKAVPPAGITANPDIYKPGYDSNITGDFPVTGWSQDIRVSLPYLSFAPPGYFDIIDYMPVGENVSLNEPIRMEFSRPVNMTTLSLMLSTIPSLSNTSFVFNDNLTVVSVEHDGFDPDTEYTITIGGYLLSLDGYLLNGGSGFTWNFTTGTGGGRWSIFSSLITIGFDKSWNITAVGGADQNVYFIIDQVGSFPMEETGIDGNTSRYSLFIEGNLFMWEETYFFRYSKTEGGMDMAVDFSGFRLMPPEPSWSEPEWAINGASVSLDDQGNWIVEVEGNENLTIYIVIDGIGSFLLSGGSDGTYSLVISYTNFEADTEYQYHFSNSSGGPDLAPGYSGTVITPKEDEGGKESYLVPILLIIIALLLITAAVIALVIALRKSGEEAEDWEEE
ncbi:MAG: hypothetical protein ACMUIG_07505 [Thermoplasmatota archaeon]